MNIYKNSSKIKGKAFGGCQLAMYICLVIGYQSLKTKQMDRIDLATQYIIDNNIVARFGTGSESVSNEIATIQERFIKNKFGLSLGEFSLAMEGARDYASESHTEACKAKNEWRCQQ